MKFKNTIAYMVVLLYRCFLSQVFLRFIRLLITLPAIGRYVHVVFDPNWIRRHSSYEVPEFFVTQKYGTTSYIVDISDHIGYISYMRREPFEMSVFRLLDAIIEEVEPEQRGIVLDIGANIGLATIPICNKYDLELLAVEASRQTASKLLHNLGLNDIRASVSNVALVRTNDEPYVSFFSTPGNSGAASIYEEWNRSNYRPSSVQRVPVMTLDGLLGFRNAAAQDVMFVKLDVEGAEYDVLQGASKFLASTHAPILMEYRSDISITYLGEDLEKTVKFLESFGYKIFVFDGRRVSDDFEYSGVYENIIALKANGTFPDYDEINKALALNAERRL